MESSGEVVEMEVGMEINVVMDSLARF
jgi:hypothetical protein